MDLFPAGLFWTGLDGFGGFSGWGSKQRHGLPPSSEVGLAWKMQAQDAFGVGFIPPTEVRRAGVDLGCEGSGTDGSPWLSTP
jgi:hypothetical protein